MDGFELHDYAGRWREVLRQNVSKVVLDDGRVWVQLTPGFTMIEAQNVNDVRVWASEAKIPTEEFDADTS